MTKPVEAKKPRVANNGEPRNPIKGRLVYLSGPMSHKPGWNFLAFRDAAEGLLNNGALWVSDPSENGSDGDWEEFLALDIPRVCAAEVVVVLPGWRQSRGATLEVTIAATLGKPVLHYPSLKPVKDIASFKWVAKPRGVR